MPYITYNKKTGKWTDWGCHYPLWEITKQPRILTKKEVSFWKWWTRYDES